MMKKITSTLFTVLMAATLSACKPTTPRVDPLAAQHEALNKAKALGSQLQQQADQRMKGSDESR